MTTKQQEVPMPQASIEQMICPQCEWDFATRTVKPCSPHRTDRVEIADPAVQAAMLNLDLIVTGAI